MPRVLFSAPECQVVVIDLQRGEELGDHHVRERAVVEVMYGSVAVQLTGDAVDCSAGTVVRFDPGEHQAVRALADARLLLFLAPWPNAQHYAEGESALMQSTFRLMRWSSWPSLSRRRQGGACSRVHLSTPPSCAA